MLHSSKRSRLTFETNVKTQSEIQDLDVVQVPIDEEDEGMSSVPGSSSQADEDTSSLQISVNVKPLDRSLPEKKVAALVHSMILKYRLRKAVTKTEMLKVVKRRRKYKFCIFFQKAHKCLELISGIEVKDVDPTTHSYVLVNSLDLTCDELLSDDWSMPKNGFLMIILCVILAEGNCTLEEDVWDFLKILGVYKGRMHFLCGEPRELLTGDWVQENYLEYQHVPKVGPPRYAFLWGLRAYAESNKM